MDKIPSKKKRRRRKKALLKYLRKKGYFNNHTRVIHIEWIGPWTADVTFENKHVPVWDNKGTTTYRFHEEDMCEK